MVDFKGPEEGSQEAAVAFALWSFRLTAKSQSYRLCKTKIQLSYPKYNFLYSFTRYFIHTQFTFEKFLSTGNFYFMLDIDKDFYNIIILILLAKTTFAVKYHVVGISE
jgi:hypothetical protein